MRVVWTERGLGRAADVVSDARTGDGRAPVTHATPVRLTRRGLLTGAALAGAGAVLGAGCAGGHEERALSGDVDNDDFGWEPPRRPPAPGVQRYLTRDEMRTLEALAARLLPGSPDDPGAAEAGAAVFIDAMLAEFDDFDEPTYVDGPFVDEPERSPDLPDGAADLPDDVLARYGFQSGLTPQQTYRRGLAALDRATEDMTGGAFAAAAGDDQDMVVAALADGSAPGFDRPSASDFFDRVREDVIHAVFADPVYGGNRDMVGWKLIGYPGAQRAWTPDELQSGPNPSRPYQGLHELHASHPGRPADSAIRPVQEPDPAVHP